MTFNRNKPNTNSNKKDMTVANITHPISKENKKALEMLEKIETSKKQKFRII